MRNLLGRETEREGVLERVQGGLSGLHVQYTNLERTKSRGGRETLGSAPQPHNPDGISDEVKHGWSTWGEGFLHWASSKTGQV